MEENKWCITNPFYPTGNIEADLKFLKSYYKDVIGKIPEKVLLIFKKIELWSNSEFFFYGL